jgi:hypothetical protein
MSDQIENISEPKLETVEHVTGEIVVVDDNIMLGAIPAKPQEIVQRATEIATELAKIIDTKRLFKIISGKKFVYVEGWSTLGAMLGILPVENRVNAIENGWEAYVDLIRARDGVKIGGASAICTSKEKAPWNTAPSYAVRSMSITRATGKAFRLGFSWIMQLAGYETTPGEEMIGDEPAETPKPRVPVATKKEAAHVETVREGKNRLIAELSPIATSDQVRQSMAETDAPKYTLEDHDKVKLYVENWITTHAQPLKAPENNTSLS